MPVTVSTSFWWVFDSPELLEPPPASTYCCTSYYCWSEEYCTTRVESISETYFSSAYPCWLFIEEFYWCKCYSLECCSKASWWWLVTTFCMSSLVMLFFWFFMFIVLFTFFMFFSCMIVFFMFLVVLFMFIMITMIHGCCSCVEIFEIFSHFCVKTCSTCWFHCFCSTKPFLFSWKYWYFCPPTNSCSSFKSSYTISSACRVIVLESIDSRCSASRCKECCFTNFTIIREMMRVFFNYDVKIISSCIIRILRICCYYFHISHSRFFCIKSRKIDIQI